MSKHYLIKEFIKQEKIQLLALYFTGVTLGSILGGVIVATQLGIELTTNSILFMFALAFLLGTTSFVFLSKKLTTLGQINKRLRR